jgi:hypothetical protein
MYEPIDKKYYANDKEFDSLEEAQKFLDSGGVNEDLRGAYERGLFEDGGYMSYEGVVNSFKDFTKYVQKRINQYPNLKSDILDFYFLAKSEIEDGGSEIEEVNRGFEDIEELIKNLPLANNENIISVGNFEIFQFNEYDAFNWYKATEKAKDLGEGWRLPTIEEFKQLLPFKEKIKYAKVQEFGKDRIHNFWSSTETGRFEASTFQFYSSTRYDGFGEPFDANDYVNKRVTKEYQTLIIAIRDNLKMSKGGWVLVNADTERKIGEYATESEARQMMYEYDGDSFVIKKSELEKEKLRETYKPPAPLNPASYIGMKRGGGVGNVYIALSKTKNGLLLSERFDKQITHQQLVDYYKKRGYEIIDSNIFKVTNKDVLDVYKDAISKFIEEKYNELVDWENTFLSYEIVGDRIIAQSCFVQTQNGKEYKITPNDLVNKKFAEGGGVKDFNSLIGKYVNIYSMGVSLPTEHQIKDVEVSGENFRYRYVTLKFDLGIAPIPFNEATAFMNNEIIYVNNNKEEFGVQLMPNQYKKGGSMSNALKYEDYETASMGMGGGYEEQIIVPQDVTGMYEQGGSVIEIISKDKINKAKIVNENDDYNVQLYRGQRQFYNQNGFKSLEEAKSFASEAIK